MFWHAVCAHGWATTTGPDATQPPRYLIKNLAGGGGGGWHIAWEGGGAAGGGGSHARTGPGRPPRVYACVGGTQGVSNTTKLKGTANDFGV